MSTPATLAQGQKLLALLSEAGATVEQVQTLLANGDLVRVMLLADLARVDREAFETLLVPQPVSTDWTPVDQYGAKLRDWNTRFKLGFTKRQIDALVAELPAHAGSLQPTSITLATGKGLQHDWDVVMQILMHELRQVGVGLGVYIAGSRISCYPALEWRVTNVAWSQSCSTSSGSGRSRVASQCNRYVRRCKASRYQPLKLRGYWPSARRCMWPWTVKPFQSYGHQVWSSTPRTRRTSAVARTRYSCMRAGMAASGATTRCQSSVCARNPFPGIRKDLVFLGFGLRDASILPDTASPVLVVHRNRAFPFSENI